MTDVETISATYSYCVFFCKIYRTMQAALPPFSPGRNSQCSQAYQTRPLISHVSVTPPPPAPLPLLPSARTACCSLGGLANGSVTNRTVGTLLEVRPRYNRSEIESGIVLSSSSSRLAQCKPGKNIRQKWTPNGQTFGCPAMFIA